jgi:polyphosphate kinase
MADTVKARIQQPDGNFLRASKLIKDVPLFSSQDFLIQLAESKTDLEAIPAPAADEPRAPSAQKAATAAD